MQDEEGRWPLEGTYEFAAELPEVYELAEDVEALVVEVLSLIHICNEYLSSSPKYNRLYDAFGWEVPVYVHCPTITNEEHKKLSKRSGHSSYQDLIDQGFVSEAVVNFVALLGWSPENNQEIFSLDELVKEFNYKNISKSCLLYTSRETEERRAYPRTH